jgi:Spy/CpxP family protein refolding chaperone
MKKFLALAVVAVMVTSVAAVYAGEGCGAGKSVKGAACCGDMFSKLNLTPDQKARVNNLLADCHRATSHSEFQAMFSSGLEKILTPDQFAQWKASCNKASNSGGCPFMKSSGASPSKT